MPDRKYVYQVEMDLAQATAAARRLRELFSQEISAGIGGRGGQDAPAAAVEAAVRPAQELKRALEGVAQVDTTAGADALNDRLRLLQEQIRSARNEYERLGYTADSVMNDTRSQRERAMFGTYVEEVRKAAGDDAAASASRLGRAINIGQRGAEFKSDQVSDYTELEQSVLARYEDLGEKQKFSAQEKQRLIELESQMYTAELEQVRIQQELAQRRRQEIEGQIGRLTGAESDVEVENLYAQMQEVYDSADRLAEEERGLLRSVTQANERLAAQMQSEARQAAVDAGQIYQRQGGQAGPTTYTQQTAISVTKASAENAERLAAELRTAAQATDDLVAATTRLAGAERERARAANEPAIDLKRLELERQRMQIEAEAASQAQRTTQTQAQTQRAATQTALAEANQRLTAEKTSYAQQTAAARTESQERIQAARTEAALIGNLSRVQTATAIEEQRRQTAAYRAELRQQEQAARESSRMRGQFSGGGIGGALGRVDYLAGMASGGLAMYGLGQLAQTGYDAARTGAQQLRMAETFETMAQRVGVSASRVKAAIQSASRETINDSDAMGLAAQVLAQKFAGSSQDIVGDLQTVVAFSRRASQVYVDEQGQFLTTQEVFARLVKYTREGNKELVDQFGISNQIIADALGTTVEGLASAGGASERWRGLIKVLNGEMERLGEATVTMADQIEASERRSTDAWNRMKQALAPLGAAAAEGTAFVAERLAVETGTAGLPQIRNQLGARWNYTSPDVGRYLETAKQYDAALAQNEESARSYEAELVRLGGQLARMGSLNDEEDQQLATIGRRLDLVAQGQDSYTRAMQQTTMAGAENNTEILSIVVAMANYEEMLISGLLTMPEYIKGLDALATHLGVVAAAAGYAADGIAAVNRMGGKAGAEVMLTTAGRQKMAADERMRDIRGAAPSYTNGRTGVDPLTGAISGAGSKGDRSRAGDPFDVLADEAAAGQKKAADEAARSWGSAADKTAREFEQAAEAAARAFESSLSKVPGLFGSSSVTAEDMDAAKAGTYRDKADERLRQLADEVINGVETPEDPRDWAARMGMDPNTDPKRVYSEAQARWADSSLFAGGQNLDLIRWDVVQADKERQGQGESGRQAILDYAQSMYGIAPPQEREGYAAQAGVGAVLPKDQATPEAAATPPEDDGGAAASLIGAIQDAFNTDYARTTLAAVGESMIGMVHVGWESAAPKYDWLNAPMQAAVDQAIQQITDSLTPPGTP